MHVIWISGDASLVNALRKKGFIAYERWSLEGVYHALTARFYIYNSYIGDVNQWFASGSIKINLWHGSPLKRIEFDIDHGPLAHKYQSNSYWQKTWHSLLYHQEYVRPQLMLSPSPLVDRLFCSAFRLQKNNCSVAVIQELIFIAAIRINVKVSIQNLMVQAIKRSYCMPHLGEMPT